MNETEFLFTELLNCQRIDLYLERDRLLDRSKSRVISRILKRRVLGEPLQYIVNTAYFMGLRFKVGKGVFIPRPETEILVESVLKYQRPLNKRKITILDLCTGSGCIAVSLSVALPYAEITASDISEAALDYAKKNARLNNANVDFIQSDLFKAELFSKSGYDIITFNPPYIPRGEISLLEKEITFEPCLSLDGGPDGLDFYKRIIPESVNMLVDGGLLVMEIGYAQADSVKRILKETGNFKLTEIARDYNNIDRVVIAQKVNSYGKTYC